MRHHRRRIVTAVLTMLLTTGSWLAMQAARPERAPNLVRVPDWQPQTWHRLDDHGSVATCELPAGHRYRLVLGCLGDATHEHRVSVRLTESSSERSEASDHRSTSKFPTWQVGPRTRPAVISAPPSTQHIRPNLSLVTPRDFFLHVTDGELDDPKQYARIRAINVASGNRVRVFVDPLLAKGEVPQSRIDELVRMLESDVIPRVESRFGNLRDVDGDGGLAVLLTPWLSRLQGGRTSISGMVRSSDFQRNLSPPFSNRCDMLFLNSSLPSDAALRDLLSHEVAHAACISQRLSRGSGTLRDEEDWLSEALAHLAEPGWSNLDHRLVAFLDDPSRYPLVVPDYYRAGLWRDPGCRGATFLFTRWCVGREPHLLRQLAQSPERGTRNLERVTGRRFEELFREWSLSLANGDELDSADLKSVLQRLGSAGIRPTVIDTNSGEVTLPIRGTAFTVVDLLVDESSSRTLRIAGDSSAKWQFSICRCPDESHVGSEGNTLAKALPQTDESL
jgi:hypothetical protein